jgi:hypothetical protein
LVTFPTKPEPTAAMVHDRLQEVRCRGDIRKWAESAVIADEFSMYVVAARTQHNNTTVVTHLDGTRDKL